MCLAGIWIGPSVGFQICVAGLCVHYSEEVSRYHHCQTCFLISLGVVM